MKQADFERRHEAEWRRLEERLIRAGRSGPTGLTTGRLPAAWTDWPERYRAVCRDLAMATARGYSPKLVARLEALALGGHRILYVREFDVLRAVVRFFAADFPRRVREERAAVGLAALLFLAPALAIFLAVRAHPEFVYSVYPWPQLAELEALYDPAAERIGANPDASSAVMMYGYYVWNNIGIAFRCFALGLFAGLGSAWVLVTNGLLIGAAAAHMLRLGFEATFFPFVIGHGALELTAIVLSGAAGLRLGGALIAPGPRPRLEALRIAARDAIPIVYGVTAMLLLASAIEAFWSARGSLPIALKLSVGGGLWAAVFGYFLFVGRGGAPPPEPARGP